MSNYHDSDAPQLVEHINQNVTFTPYDTKWVPCSARFVSCGITPNVRTTTFVLVTHTVFLKKIISISLPLCYLYLHMPSRFVLYCLPPPPWVRLG